MRFALTGVIVVCVLAACAKKQVREESPPIEPPALRCSPAEKAELLHRALAATTDLPVASDVGADGAVHLRYTGAELDVATATELASLVPPAWATEAHLHLEEVSSVAPDAAAALVNWYAEDPETTLHLHLGAIKLLNVDAAIALVEWQGIDPKAAAELGDLYGEPTPMYLHLNGIEVLSAPVARALLDRSSQVYKRLTIKLDGVVTIESDGWSSLRPDEWSDVTVSLRGLNSLDAATATELARWVVARLHLDGVEALTPEAATALVAFAGKTLSLNGLTRVDPVVLRALVAWNERRPAEERKIAAAILAQPEHTPTPEEEYFSVEERIEAAIASLYEKDLWLGGLETSESVEPLLSKWAGPSSPVSPPPADPPAEEDVGWGCELTRTAVRELPLGSPELARALEWWEPFRVDALLGTAVPNKASTELTPEEAQELIDRTDSQSLHLNDVTSLSPAAAAVLAQWEGRRLYLNGLRSLDVATALELAQWEGRKLELDGLGELSPDIAAALATWPGRTLELDGVHALDAATAGALASWPGRKLELDGVTALDMETVDALARWEGDEIEFDGLDYVDREVVRALVDMDPEVIREGLPISLDETARGVAFASPIEPTLAKLLGRPATTMSFLSPWVLRSAGTTLTADEAAWFTNLSDVADLDLSSVTTLDASAAQVLARWQGSTLRLGLESLDAETAAALAAWQGDTLHLTGLATLTPEAATALANWTGEVVHLDGLETLDPATAAALATLDGDVSLTGLRQVDAPTLDVMLPWRERLILNYRTVVPRKYLDKVSDITAAGPPVRSGFEGKAHEVALQ